MRKKHIVLQKFMITLSVMLLGITFLNNDVYAGDFSKNDLRIVYCGGLMGNIEPCG